MVDFTASLLETLEKSREGFEKADNEFRSTLNELNDSIAQVTKGKFSLSFSLLAEEEEGTTYRLDINEGNDSKEIGAYRISLKGYPIDYGDYDQIIERFHSQGYLMSKVHLENHFKAMTENPDSTLMTFIAFKRRSED
jgi:hypothetical protein